VKAVSRIAGRGMPLPRRDIDTDQIIPSRYLKRIERTGFGEGLFAEWRTRSRLRPRRSPLRRRGDPHRRGELRLRELARARRLGT